MGQLFSWFKRTPPRLQSKDLEGVAAYIASGRCKNIVIMAGAGISRAAGIPDFRSQGGLYDVLRKWNIDVRRPEDIFTLSRFKEDPKPFYKLMSQLYGGSYRPTLTHSFFRLLDKRRVLNACWTQNVDNLECLAGLPARRLIEAHGTLDSQHCTSCGAKCDDRKMKHAVVTGDIPVCEKKGCGGFVKPDVVMFGESLPLKFWLNLPFLKRADLLIIVGTSLAVPPFSFIANWVPTSCPRVVINMEPVWGVGGRANDVEVLGDCDETVRRLAQLIGADWEAQLDALWKETEGKVFQYKEGVPA
ncbi:DHS-like NAD/FAD-binding domain-containing protein [Mycena maculata]|uniref:DHS-like NAD/FAD-binding domain-containing protein n=1 Tax=Mycena maculata TaxID=230809 RepID=A0AAD7N912_9AGAR|nr:DHS-like NAD/FAD-binding domain-containing protein [Mycena maculata]